VNRLEHGNLVRLVGCHDHPSDPERGDALGPERLEESWRRRRPERTDRVGYGIVNDGAIFADDQIEGAEVRTDLAQVIYFAAGYQQDTPAAPAQSNQRVASARGNLAAEGQRSVVVTCESVISHLVTGTVMLEEDLGGGCRPSSPAGNRPRFCAAIVLLAAATPFAAMIRWPLGFAWIMSLGNLRPGIR
jgi:hypothetical protein